MDEGRKGITLIELVIVIVIMAVITAVVVASITSSGSNRLEGAANRLMSDIRYAQQLAISRQYFCGVLFNPSGNSYYVYTTNTTTIPITTRTAAMDPFTRNNSSIDYNTDSDYKGVSLSNTNFGDEIFFNYIGTPYNSSGSALLSQGVVTLTYGSSTKTVTIEPNTGEIKLQ